jgi:5-methylcytosine-specific restriction endonuclease McrA
MRREFPTTSRSVKEWVGKTPDSKVPNDVRLRIFRNNAGLCYLTLRRIAPGDAWELEHIIPLSMGGEHKEINLRPALVAPHKEKSAREAGQRAKADAVAKSALGIKSAPRRPIQSPGFVKAEPAKTDKLPIPPRRSLYETTL